MRRGVYDRVYDWVTDNPMLCVGLVLMMVAAAAMAAGSQAKYHILDGGGDVLPTLSPDVHIPPAATPDPAWPSRPSPAPSELPAAPTDTGDDNASMTFRPNNTTFLAGVPTLTPTPTPTPVPTPHLTPLSPYDMGRLKGTDIPYLTKGLGVIVPDETTKLQQYYYRGDVVPIHIEIFNEQPRALTNQTLEFTLFKEVGIVWPEVYKRYTAMNIYMPAGESAGMDYVLQVPTTQNVNIGGLDVDTAGLYQVRLALYDTDSRKMITTFTFRVNIL